jgi:hypothetical protein
MLTTPSRADVLLTALFGSFSAPRCPSVDQVETLIDVLELSPSARFADVAAALRAASPVQLLSLEFVAGVLLPVTDLAAAAK